MIALSSASVQHVMTTPQRTRVRDVQHAVIMATVWVDDDKIKSDYKKNTWNYVCLLNRTTRRPTPMTTWKPTRSTWNATLDKWMSTWSSCQFVLSSYSHIGHHIAWLKLSACLPSSQPCIKWALLFDFELSIPSNFQLFLLFYLQQLLLPINFHEDT